MEAENVVDGQNAIIDPAYHALNPVTKDEFFKHWHICSTEVHPGHMGALSLTLWAISISLGNLFPLSMVWPALGFFAFITACSTIVSFIRWRIFVYRWLKGSGYTIADLIIFRGLIVARLGITKRELDIIDRH